VEVKEGAKAQVPWEMVPNPGPNPNPNPNPNPSPNPNQVPWEMVPYTSLQIMDIAVLHEYLTLTLTQPSP